MRQTKRKCRLGEVRLTQLLPRLSCIGDFTEVQAASPMPVTQIDRRNLTVPNKVACLCSANADAPIIEKEIVMKRTCSNRTLARQAGTSAVSLALGALFIGGSMSAAAAPPEGLKFDMAVSAAAAGCLPNAQGHVTVRQAGANQRMQVSVNGLPPNTEFALFVLQVPTAPFAMSWYQGDIVTDNDRQWQSAVSWDFQQRAFCLRPCDPRRSSDGSRRRRIDESRDGTGAHVPSRAVVQRRG